MPLNKINTNNPIRGIVNPTRRQLQTCHTVIGQLDFADLGRGAGTLHEVDDVRLDMQGRTAAGDANIQVQIGNGTAAAALIANSVQQTQDPANQRGAARASRDVLNQSLSSQTIWNLTGSLPMLDAEEMNESSIPTSQALQTNIYEPATRQYVFNKTGNIMITWAGPDGKEMPPSAEKLFNEAAEFYTKMLKKITNTINPVTGKPYSIYNYNAIMEIIDQSDSFVSVNQQDITYKTTLFGTNYSQNLVKTLLGFDLKADDLAFAQGMIVSMGDAGLKIGGSANSEDSKIANIVFVCEYLCGVPLVSAIVVSCDVKLNSQTFKTAPCLKEIAMSTTLKMNKETYMFLV